MSSKERLDVLLVNRGLADSREKAKAIIMSGNVYVDGQKEDKAGSSFNETVNIEVRGNTLKYVSRGGLKLEKAMENFDVTIEGKICMDVGSSTGGFTDCMLQNGAVKVYSVDVGHGQLAWKLRNDERVVCMEKTNIRYVTPEDIADKIDFSSIDVSFISLADSREKAKAIIMSGNVYVDGQKEDKAGSSFNETVNIEVRGNTLKYVSRGGLKLEKAMENFDVTIEGKICMDVGSSTGGFTDCMLQNGAVKVYSVDVGHGQLAWKLRNDERVVCMEKTNIRYVTPEDIADKIDFSSIDVSFISLTKVLLPVKNLLTDDGQIVCLIKPQFEAGREKVGKHGVVRDKAVHIEVIEMVINYAISIGFEILNLEFSPVKGPEGNIEYLLHLQKHIEGTYDNIPFTIQNIVDKAHETL